MYIITADDTVTRSGDTYVIHEGVTVHESGSSDKYRLAIVAGLSLEINKSGTLNLTLPPTNEALTSGALHKLKTIIRIYKGTVSADNLVWKGRILDSSRDFLGRVTYRCEGWLSVLCDSVVLPTANVESDEKITATPKAMFESLITAHNSMVDTEKQFQFHTYGFGGDDEVSSAATHSRLAIGSTGDEVTLLQQYLNKLGYTAAVDGVFGSETENAVRSYQTDKGLTVDGIVYTDTWNALDADISGASRYVATSVDFPNGSYENTFDYIQTNLLQNIEIGGQLWVNESDIYYFAEGYEDFAGQDIVFGQNLLDLTEFVDASQIYTVLIPIGKDDLMVDGTYVEDASAINLFGRIVRKEDFSDIEDATELATAAQKTLAENIKENTTIDISAFDLSLLNVDESAFKVGEFVRIVSQPHNVDSYYLCTAITIDLCNPAKSTYTLGVNPDTLTGKMTNNRLHSNSGSSGGSSGGGGSERVGTYMAVDVSEHNGTINWSAAVGVLHSVVIRVNRWNTDSSSPYYHYLYDAIDLNFVEHYQGASAIGLDIGAYVYVAGRTAEEARYQAQFAVGVLQQNNCTLRQPVWLDMEESYQESLGKDTIAAMIEAFRSVVEDAGYVFGIYTNRNWWTYILPDYVKSDYPCWIASFPEEAYDNGTMKESLRPSYGVGWQYSGYGRIEGFQNYVYNSMLDMDVFYKAWPPKP